ncbi:MAG: DUF3153 domain-containing protein [Cyanobacteria bacterium J06635_15]
MSFGFLLSGCIQYDVGIQFDSQTHGQLTQTIHLNDRVIALNPIEAQQWLTQLGETAQSLGGSITQPDDQTLTLAIPFNNGEQLVETFNRFFEQTPLSPFIPAIDTGALPQPKSTLILQQRNRLLAIQNHLIYDLDLRDVVQPAIGDRGILSQLEALTLDFRLTTPWGIQSVAQPQGFQNTSTLFPTLQGNTARWSLIPGSLNHIDVVFWVPSPIGLGALAIILLVAVGYGVKYAGGRRTVID